MALAIRGNLKKLKVIVIFKFLDCFVVAEFTLSAANVRLLAMTSV